MSRKKTDPAPERVEMVNGYGAIARPLVTDEAIWLAAGWKRVEKTKEQDDG